ncbi:ribosomal protein S18-alanine N-acetyltransferase [Desulfobaculum bizertense]|uniref:Ribosomal-protein-alanine N-acetyltransferase n=1 Tax=Desulfobaculum bizertense DSM 18034 TaxID=1121442 RepID=A0A1T4W359_9BACT|nr:ribosomal protein S18-alanine N-acetyltransferase [Desulfobaculum bizertense]SKA71498.1 ribosomal-protein-alanine N-acetyltransferase [Desulfobaculum bizertense DSM 18034]
MDYSFEQLGEKDLPELVALEKQCFSHPWGEKEFRLGLERKIFYVFGFTSPDGLLAYCSLHMVAGEAEILNIAVRSDLRRRGLGERLLRLIVQISKKMNIQSMYLEVRVSNLPAQALYRKLGFEQVGMRKKYYPDTGEDALVLRLDVENRESFPSAKEPGA